MGILNQGTGLGALAGLAIGGNLQSTAIGALAGNVLYHGSRREPLLFGAGRGKSPRKYRRSIKSKKLKSKKLRRSRRSRSLKRV